MHIFGIGEAQLAWPPPYTSIITLEGRPQQISLLVLAPLIDTVS